MDGNEARASLDAVRQTDRRMAGQMTWPLWRHAAFGAIEALFVLGWGLPSPGMAACLVIAIGGIFWINRDDRKRHGMFVSGFTSRAARPAIWLAFAIVIAGLGAVLLTGGLNRWTPWVPVIVGLVFVLETLASLWWQKLYLAELRSEQA
ncbi:MAG: hypothetical protein WBA68_09070 [Alteraurantiacibacter sp.]